MKEQEILNILNHKHLNTKTNNYIFSEIREEQQDSIIAKVNPICLLDNLEADITDEIGTNKMNNVTIDLSQVSTKDILTVALELLKIKESIPFESKMNLLKLRGILRTHRKAIQFIFYHLDHLTIEEQKLLNEIYWFNTYFFNANALIARNHFITTQTQSGYMLDNREDYDKRSLC